MKHLKISALALFLFFACVSTARAQATPAEPAPAFTTQSFSFQANAIALPGGGSTTAGALTGVTLGITPNVSLRNTDFVASSGNATGYFGGVDYTVSAFSKWLNNISPNLNGYNFQFQLTASFGVDRIDSAAMTASERIRRFTTTSTTAGTVQHYAWLAGGRLNYAVNGSQNFGLGVEIQYARLPGFANNTAIVSFGPNFHF